MSDSKDSSALLANLLKMKRAHVVLFLAVIWPLLCILDQILPLACETMRRAGDK